MSTLLLRSGSLAALSLTLAGAIAQPAAAETVLRMANWLPPSHPLVADVMRPFAEKVAEATEGRVTIEILDAPLGPPPAHFDFAVEGIADITFGVHGYTPGRFRTAVLAEVPLLGDSAEATSVAYWRLFEEMLAATGEHDDVKVLAVFTHGPGHIFTRNRDLSSIEGVQGARLRVGGDMASEVLGALGGVPLHAPSSQAYEMLSGGVADGILFPFESVVFFNLHGLVDQGLIVPGGLYNMSFFVVMNRDRWESLPEEDRAAIDSVSGEALARLAGQAWDAADAEGRAAMEGVVSLREADPDEVERISELLQPVVDAQIAAAAATGIDAEAALEWLRAEIATLEAEQ